MAALWNVCGSWLRFEPQVLTSFTAATMALRSLTLCDSSPARFWAACSWVGSAGDEVAAVGETGADVVGETGTPVVAVLLAATGVVPLVKGCATRTTAAATAAAARNVMRPTSRFLVRRGPPGRGGCRRGGTGGSSGGVTGGE